MAEFGVGVAIGGLLGETWLLDLCLGDAVCVESGGKDERTLVV